MSNRHGVGFAPFRLPLLTSLALATTACTAGGGVAPMTNEITCSIAVPGPVEITLRDGGWYDTTLLPSRRTVITR